MNQKISFLSQSQTPLLTALLKLSLQKDAAFYAPGHKKGGVIEPQLEHLFGKKVFCSDLPELPELDNLFAPQDAILKAQDLASQCFGADRTWFLINGSTCGIISAIVATCGAGDKIILPRNIHQSAIAGLIISGAIPVFVNPEHDNIRNITYNITPQALKKTLNQYPETKAVMVLHPSYQGVCGDLRAISEITNQHNIPLLVDEAHGGHFAFHEQLPPSALSLGADLTVQSTHKVLGAMTQASMLHLRGTRINPQRISKALQIMQSTSPSYILLASLDAARKQMALQGEQFMEKALELADLARENIANIPKLSVLEFSPKPGFKHLDKTRLTVDIRELGITGYEADEILHQQLGVTCELPLLYHLTFIITFGNNQQDIEKLIQGFVTLCSTTNQNKQSSSPATITPSTPKLQLSPREAYFAATETIPLSEASDRISGELICPYPPGIPVLMPGEVITSEAIDYLQKVLNSGGIITGCSDETLTNISVIEL
ncbi:Arginine/lysine/ornithine decarboxylase [Hyella patelloides LEGE 07179]|uniref:Arginine/lysine/ornithine decarboxylase n=1 Tax=Hyella patelloides LEGE 07179 TaxID=945734 RepID=A0A563VQM2_9CYAN|nr:aminotransferase class I/II-fold pyridoxal phosphate-dependent enzyme [Hyella patelloides]VEP13700.1 Arginine/lysine/ornithine decarboxylase [Hyella patelloides LEGE 07179]